MRKAEIKRETKETNIKLILCIDGRGSSEINSGCGFLDHMLTLFASHGRFDLVVKCSGDTYVDDHHTTEDIGICLGKAFADALGDCRGIKRYGSMFLPMDEALVLTSLDVSGRGYLSFDCAFPTEKVGNFDTELVREFFAAFVRSFAITLHVKMLSGYNSHHIAEAIFKSVAHSLRNALETDPKLDNEIPSTKGWLV